MRIKEIATIEVNSVNEKELITNALDAANLMYKIEDSSVLFVYITNKETAKPLDVLNERSCDRCRYQGDTRKKAFNECLTCNSSTHDNYEQRMPKARKPEYDEEENSEY